MASFLPICLNPTLQKTIVLSRLVENEVNRSGEYYLDASGKGVNVARVLTHLGEGVVHLTHLGGRNVDLFLDLAASDEVPIRWVDSHSEIRFCYTLISDAANTTTEIVEEAEPVSASAEEALLDLYLELLPSVDVVTISGSKAPGYSAELFPTMVREAKAAGRFVILDYRGADLRNSLIHRPDIIKPNLAEFAQTFLDDGKSVAEIGEQSTDDALLDRVCGAMMELRSEFGCDVVLTRGARDILYTTDTGIGRHAPRTVTPRNTIGSGDAFTAGLGSALLRGESLPAAVGEAAECAATNATLLRPGVLR